jgi:hypothetical protein
VKKTAADDVDRKQFVFPSIARGAATQRLISDFAALKTSDSKLVGFEAAPFENNLYRWRVKLWPASDSELYKDLQKIKRKIKSDHILLEMLFPCEYPK